MHVRGAQATIWKLWIPKINSGCLFIPQIVIVIEHKYEDK